ncbi:unnamed protein product, partial [Prorocentrum cordatum]
VGRGRQGARLARGPGARRQQSPEAAPRHLPRQLQGPQAGGLAGSPACPPGGGETIKGIRERSGADIKIEHVPTDPEGTATIIGDVQKTEEMIKEALASKGYPLLPPGERKMQLLPGGMPQMPGLNGASGPLGGAPVPMVPPGGMLPPAGGMQAPLALPPLAGGAAQPGMLPPVARPQGMDPSADVEVPAELVQLLIGPGGANLKDIRARTGDRVYISVMPASMPGGPQYVRCVGEASEMAKGLVRAKLEELRPGAGQLQGPGACAPLQPQVPSFGAGTPGCRPVLARPYLAGGCGGCGGCGVISGASAKSGHASVYMSYDKTAYKPGRDQKGADWHAQSSSWDQQSHEPDKKSDDEDRNFKIDQHCNGDQDGNGARWCEGLARGQRANDTRRDFLTAAKEEIDELPFVFLKVREMDEVFDSVLQLFGYVQNLGEQEFLTYFASQGTRARHLVRNGISGIRGKIKDRVRCLGPRILVRDSKHQEVARRCSAARTAFYRVGGIWSLAISFKLRKLLLVGNAQNAILSGLEAFVLSKADRRRLGSCLASLARLAMLASPWLSQMTRDLEFAAGVVDSEAIDVLLNDMNTFNTKGEMKDFCALDMGVLRASSIFRGSCLHSVPNIVRVRERPKMELAMPSWFSGKKREGDNAEPPSAGAAGSAAGGRAKTAKKGDRGGKGGEDMAKVVAQVVRLLLTVTRELGDVASVVFLRWDIALDRGLPACLAVSGKKCDDQSKDMRARQAEGVEQDFKARGPPHIHISASAMQSCAARAPTAGSTEEAEKTLKQDSKDWWTQHMREEMPLKEIGRAVPYFRCKPLRRENRCAIVTRADFNKPMGVEAPRNLEAVIEAEGGEFLLGSALMGAKRLIQSRISVPEPSDLPAGVPPTAVKSPPATRMPPPVSALAAQQLHSNQMKTLLDQMHVMAQQLAEVQLGLATVPVRPAGPMSDEEIMRLAHRIRIADRGALQAAAEQQEEGDLEGSPRL